MMKTLKLTIVFVAVAVVVSWAQEPVLMPGWPFSVSFPEFIGGRTLFWEAGCTFISAGPEEGQVCISFGLLDSSIYIVDKEACCYPCWPRRGFGPAMCDMAVGDVDGDGAQELVGLYVQEYPSARYRMHVFRQDGSDLPGFPRELPAVHPSLFDLNEDGKLEIMYCLHTCDSTICVLDHGGENFPGWPQVVHGDYMASWTPSVGDIDNDGTPEIVAAGLYSIWVWRPDGTLAAGWPVFTDSTYYHWGKKGLVLADLDGDEDLEIIVPSIKMEGWAGRLSVYHHDGRVAEGWPYLLTDGYPAFTPVIGDLDSDGSLDIVELAVSAEENLFVLEADGSIKQGWPITHQGISYSEPAAADVNGDGFCDIVLGNNLNNASPYPNPDSILGLYFAYDYRGELLTDWPVEVNGVSGRTPTVLDIDDDGNLNMVLVGDYSSIVRDLEIAYVYLYDLGVPAGEGAVQWGKFAHDQYNTNNYHFKVPPITGVPQSQSETVPVQFLLGQNYPNPFNCSTLITLRTPSSEALLEIFGVTGRRVKRYDLGAMGQLRKVVWDGTNDFGEQVSSGVYFYRLTSGEVSVIKGMVLIR